MITITGLFTLLSQELSPPSNYGSVRKHIFFFLISTDTTKVPLTFAPKSLPHHLSTLQYIMNHISGNKIISTLNLTYSKRYILIQIASLINYYYIIIHIHLSFTKLLIHFENVCTNSRNIE